MAKIQELDNDNGANRDKINRRLWGEEMASQSFYFIFGKDGRVVVQEKGEEKK